MQTSKHFPKDIEKRPKCKWLTCISGMGLAGRGYCNQGDPNDPDCQAYENEDDFLKERKLSNAKEVKNMSPKRNQQGPPKDSQGPRDGRGKGKGRNTNSPGVGRQKGGKKGIKK